MQRYKKFYKFNFVNIEKRSFDNKKLCIIDKDILISVILYELLGAIAIQFRLGVSNQNLMIIDAILIFILGLLLQIYKLEVKKKHIKDIIIFLLFLLSMTNIGIDIFYKMSIIKNKLSPNSYLSYNSIVSGSEDRYEVMKQYDDSIYRQEKKIQINLNEGLMYGVNGINFSASTYSQDLFNFLRKFGYSYQHVSILSGIGNTKTADMLFGIKYVENTDKSFGWKDYEECSVTKGFTSDNLLVDREITYTWRKNPYALSLGFSCGRTILQEVQENGCNSFLYQNALLKKVAGLDEDIFEMHEGEITKVIHNLQQNGSKYNRIDSNVASITYEIEIEKCGEAYMYIPNGDRLDYVDIYVNGIMQSPDQFAKFNKMIQLGRHDIR